MSWPLRGFENFKWSSEKTAKATDLWSRGFSATEIAKLIGCPSRNAVIGKIHRLGLRRTDAQRPKKPKAIRAKPDRKAKLLPTQVHPNHKPDNRPVRSASIAPLNLTLLMRGDGCKWPSALALGEHLFCGQSRAEHSPYCVAHHKLAFARSAA